MKVLAEEKVNMGTKEQQRMMGQVAEALGRLDDGVLAGDGGYEAGMWAMLERIGFARSIGGLEDLGKMVGNPGVVWEITPKGRKWLIKERVGLNG